MEKRKAERKATEINLKININPAQDKWISGILINLSANGACLITKESQVKKLSPHSIIHLGTFLPGSPKDAVIKASIQWIAEIKKSIGLGLEFKKDADGFLIPDDANFIQALAYAAEAQAWRERSAMKEEGAENMYQSRNREANTYFVSANGKQALRLYQAGDHLEYQKNHIKYNPEISGNYKNKRYW